MTWREWWCLTMPWHRTEIVRRYNGHFRTRCDRCGCEWGINPRVRVALPWRWVAVDFDALDRISKERCP